MSPRCRPEYSLYKSTEMNDSGLVTNQFQPRENARLKGEKIVVTTR